MRGEMREEMREEKREEKREGTRLAHQPIVLEYANAN